MYIGFISNKYNVNNEVADEANQTPGTDSEGQNPGSDHKIRYPDPTIRPFKFFCQIMADHSLSNWNVLHARNKWLNFLRHFDHSVPWVKVCKSFNLQNCLPFVLWLCSYLKQDTKLPGFKRVKFPESLWLRSSL